MILVLRAAELYQKKRELQQQITRALSDNARIARDSQQLKQMLQLEARHTLSEVGVKTLKKITVLKFNKKKTQKYVEQMLQRRLDTL